MFEKHAKLTIACVLVFLGVIGCIALEYTAGHFFGLGKPVIYDSHPVYGYRPQPNQNVMRNHNVAVNINNLGLRAMNDWDPNPHHKVLFLGDSVTYGGSYISNEQLFSTLAISPFPDYQSGNAGVNGWGVNNVCALVQEMSFLPADIYVSVFPEGDFYRGLSRIGGQPFWTRPPRFALEELFHYFVYKIQLRQMPARHFYLLPEADKTHIANIAVKNLKAMDDFLNQQGKIHLIYISPSVQQIVDHQSENVALRQLFHEHQLDVIYLKDRLKDTPAEIGKTYFHDNIHLSIKGHQEWAKMIEPDLKQAISRQEQFSYENKNS
ncbi:MAG: hypothetical protein AB7I18_06845 [Candidatus Berkiella sp.]